MICTKSYRMRSFAPKESLAFFLRKAVFMQRSVLRTCGFFWAKEEMKHHFGSCVFCVRVDASLLETCRAADLDGFLRGRTERGTFDADRERRREAVPLREHTVMLAGQVAQCSLVATKPLQFVGSVKKRNPRGEGVGCAQTR